MLWAILGSTGEGSLSSTERLQLPWQTSFCLVGAPIGADLLVMTTMSLLLTLCSDFVFTGVVFHRWMMALLLGAQRLGRDSLHSLAPPIYSDYVLTLLAEHFAVGC